MSESTTSIERDLDQTRSRLGSHLNELQDRLSPGQVLDDLMGYFRGSEGAAFGASLLDSVRANPLPAAITTVGLAWLMATNPRGAAAAKTGPALPIYGHDDHASTLSRLTTARNAVTRNLDEPDHAYAARLDVAHGQALGLARHPEETGESFSQRVKTALGGLQDAVTRKSHDLRDQAGEALGSAQGALSSLGASAQDSLKSATSYAGGAVTSGGRAAGQAGGNLVSAISESPVLLGALGLAAGALLGALLPHSEQEEAALGGIAGQARDTVRDLASQGMERGQRVVQAVTESAKSSVQEVGGGKSAGELIDAALKGDLAANAREAAAKVIQAGDEAMRKEGLGQAPDQHSA